MPKFTVYSCTVTALRDAKPVHLHARKPVEISGDRGADRGKLLGALDPVLGLNLLDVKRGGPEVAVVGQSQRR